ncbi:CDP-alcohol phosphatidyltransferase family protein [Marivita geojedonensis]|uniref:Membrane protein n=1 Tax=Marivita geojedonensis TaxID=1123756 RepID=A0A1X4NLC1_9RHOB|nr:CDP-alcohol phosphatidyltransferase family protein [Marivita geojedonensis]OSQ51082.1 membrane protein [Marivita geojedonensis]PRY79906.1 phosphatidylglycerophosphate synthase [Marivita geojedonensis]
MLDAALLPFVKRAVDRPARWLVAHGVSADQITLIGFGFGIIGVLAAAAGLFATALTCLALNRLADGLDGAVARLTRPTDRGAFLDIALDFMFYGLFPLGFALHDPMTNALPAALLICSFIGTGSSFLAFSIIAEKRGITSDQYPTKGIFYLGGLTEGTETIALFVAMCLFPAAFPWLAYTFAALCALTTLTRWLAGWRMFG